MIAIALTIIAAVWAGLAAEHRWPGRAGRGSRRTLTVVLYTVLPPVVFFNLVVVEIDADFAIGIAAGWLAVGACAYLGYLVATRLLGLSRPETGAVLVCILVANSGYLGYPLIGALLGFDRVGEAVAYDIAVSGVALLIGAFSVGAAFGANAGTGVRERTRSFFARNIPLYAGLLALIAPEALAPGWAVDASRIAVVLLLPLGFFAVGAALAEDEEEGVRLPPPLTAPVASVVLLKLALMPALLFALTFALIDLPASFLILAAMPSGLNAMIVVHAYGLDLRITAGALVWTTAIVVPVALAASLL